VISVVVTTYKRPDRLAAGLAGLRAQRRPPDEVIVVIHESDEISEAALDDVARPVRVQVPGLVAALNRGLESARGDIVAFVDDDAVAEPDWLERIEAHFASSAAVAGVGGRDIITEHGRVRGREDEGLSRHLGGEPVVGRLQWFGRHVGNHHIGVGGARDVDILKGVNMSYRRREVAHGFDRRLRGRGVEVHSELSICLPLRARGLRLVYDPDVVVRHYPTPRGFGDEREELRREVVHDETHNETLQILDHFGRVRRMVFLAWGVAVGTASAPGAAQLLRLLATRSPRALERFLGAQGGRAAAWRTRATPRPLAERPTTERATA
jgi:glycosyltransferase involved in cell wall biosynthesis